MLLSELPTSSDMHFQSLRPFPTEMRDQSARSLTGLDKTCGCPLKFLKPPSCSSMIAMQASAALVLILLTKNVLAVDPILQVNSSNERASCYVLVLNRYVAGRIQ